MESDEAYIEDLIDILEEWDSVQTYENSKTWLQLPASKADQSIIGDYYREEAPASDLDLKYNDIGSFENKIDFHKDIMSEEVKICDLRPVNKSLVS